ncbi:MAG: baeRF10 domain-containing protein [Longimicrobiales bacterium]
MLTRERLLELFQDLKDREVLSVYVDADQRDPAQRDTWRVHLEGEISRLRRSLEHANDADLASFDTAWALVSHELKTGEHASMSKRGWVAFATPDRIWHAGGVPAHMPSLVAWQRGIRAAPYVRVLKQERPVLAVLLDGRRARVFEHVEGSTAEVDGLMADTEVGDLSDSGMSKSAGRSSGVRGATSTDQGQRLREVAAERLRKELADLIDQRSRDDGIVVLGGTGDAVKRLMALLPRSLEGRVAERASLHLEMTAAEVRDEIRSAAGDLSEQGHLALVAGVADAARAGGKGALGLDDTLKALEGRRVDTLLLSRSFIQEHPVPADQAVGLAFSQGAYVEELSGEAGGRLDQEGLGIAARLRFLAGAAG